MADTHPTKQYIEDHLWSVFDEAEEITVDKSTDSRYIYEDPSKGATEIMEYDVVNIRMVLNRRFSPIIRKVNIFINGIQKEAEKRDYTYNEVMKLADLVPVKGYTMSSAMKNGNDPKHYSFEDRIKMKEGIMINVDLTNKA